MRQMSLRMLLPWLLAVSLITTLPLSVLLAVDWCTGVVVLLWWVRWVLLLAWVAALAL